MVVADWQPSDTDARQIETMAGYGLPAKDIATIIGVDVDVLEHKCRSLMASGVAKANAKVAQAIYAQASSGANLQASVEWAKLRMGWHDSDQPDQKQAEDEWKPLASAGKRKGPA